MTTTDREILGPPAALDAERGVLGAMLWDAAAVDAAGSMLTAADFYLASHRRIFAAVQETGASDVPLVMERLRAIGALDDCGGPSYLLALVDERPAMEHTGRYAAKVLEMAQRRAMLEAADVVKASAIDVSRPWSETVDDCESEVLAVGKDRGDVAHDFAAEADADLRTGVVGLPFHVRRLSTHLAMAPGVYTVVAATRKTGKSRFALGEVVDKCGSGTPVLLFSLEMTGSQVYQALYGLRLGVPLADLQAGVLARSAEWFPRRYERVVAEIRGWPLTVEARAGLTVSRMAAKARRWKRETGGGLVIVDFAQRVRGHGKDEREQLAAAARDLADMAKEIGDPMLLLSQVTETGRTSGNGMPEAHSRGSLDFEILAGAVVILNRPSQRANSDAEVALWTGRAQAYIAATRFGTDTGLMDIGWREGVGCFCDLATDSPLRRIPAAEPSQSDLSTDDDDPFGEDDGR